MSVAFDHRDPGTAESLWRSTAPWRGASFLTIDVDRLIVLAAHPDDETLGAGGLIWTAAQAGVDVSVLVATDGERSHGASDLERVAALRRGELVSALAELAPTARLRFLGLPDGGVDSARASLRVALGAEIGDDPWRVLLVAPWQGDGHRDHRVAGEEAAAAAAPGVRVLGYPVWMWHWHDPAAVDSSAWLRLGLSASARAAKRRALSHFRSQHDDSAPNGPMLHAGMLAHFERDVEIFVEEPPVHRASTPLSGFDARFEAAEDPWGFRTRWYERRKRAALLAALPNEHSRAALELGCANGVLTRELADRAARVVAVDGSPEALRHARAFVDDESHVEFAHLRLPDQWPEGRFDLIVVSEIAYYWSEHALAEAVTRIDESLTQDGAIVVCHWRRPIDDAAVSADAVHAAFRAWPHWRSLVHHREEDFALDVYVRPGVPSVATAERAP
ncbi:bifunctional PIG-L family deacetylase/class I SAM-dependent methyltransferase [Microbacterium dextranolyticum]|uniref:Methyltransferase domain-containing protein n=1 Tax=Microbacterium dextranolyticum TaxID=36806 RepID=A0A9W6HKZ8_9MICO|nr:bifunctional PIG-L family deacetylase/class I SAM-dependent methyltransferase [Microbacterium dextranolyticum]MBM7463558.1 LmbE family N-acetylglucosaminyl deacetylase [Microbacterium dextranolyticum]GLJ94661.1 hypothetical protein GCM10017591_07220 [Microbacterium dextranolyticum]